jgi:MFS family permease
MQVKNAPSFISPEHAVAARALPVRAAQPAATGTLGPLREPLFRALWLAAVASNVGTWMQDVGAAWLMTSLAPSPSMVALVRTASSLPMFLLALPAGALADVFDRRRLLLSTQLWMLSVAAALGLLTLAGLTTPSTLLALTFALGLGTALNAPAWQALMAEVVPRAQLPAAIALNSVSVNVARSVGPALGGIIIALAGPGPTFMLNALSFSGVIAVLYGWRRKPNESVLPGERVWGAMRAGLRYARHAPALRAVLLRQSAFIVFGSALWALLPAVARFEFGQGPAAYGILLGFFGVGAVMGATLLPRVRGTMSLDRLVMVASLLFAVVLVILALVREFGVVLVAMLAGGAAWLGLLSTFNSSVQALVPAWVRGRALALYILVFFGGMALGSAVWGYTANLLGLPTALLIAAAGVLLGLVLTRRVRLRGAEGLDLTPSVHWPMPTPARVLEPDQGPVVVMIEYRIDAPRRREFLRAIRRVRRIRRRDGAINWGLLTDVTDPTRHVETFVVESWIEHLRQHERVTVSDRAVLEKARAFHVGAQPPRVHHYIVERVEK